MVQAFKLPFDCQAIFLSPHADFSDPPARLTPPGQSPLCCRHFASGIIGTAMRQDRPSDARPVVTFW
jgi:hypothetical protein